MTTPSHPHGEQPSTYFVQDRSNKEELTRLQIQDDLLSTGMGGVLPEQADPTIFHQVLDVGCGTGGWLIQVAKAYPTISTLVGVDVSARMVGYAREQAQAAGVSDRVKVEVMDALGKLEFADSSFDLVNQRMNFSYIHIWEWPNLLQEYQRIARPGGIVRITESNVLGESTSPALSSLYEMALTAFHAAGHLFEKDHESIPQALPGILKQQGFQNVQTRAFPFERHPQDADFQVYYEDMSRFLHTIRPFLEKWTRIPANYDQIYRQALTEMWLPEFVATWRLLTSWGTCAEKKTRTVF